MNVSNNNKLSQKLPTAVTQMGKISLVGNIIPHQWFSKITFANGKPDLNSLVILSDVSYWYRPSVVRNEQTGAVLGYKKKFKEDLLRRSYADFKKLFGLSEKQTRDALIRLEKLGVVRRVFKAMEGYPGIKFMYIQIFPSKLNELSNSFEDYPELSSSENDESSQDYYPIETFHSNEDNISDPCKTSPTEDNKPPYIEVTPALHTSKVHIRNTKTTTKITSLSKSLSPKNVLFDSKKNERENKNISKKMIKIWNEILPEKAITSENNFLSQKLEKVFHDQLGGKLDNWKIVCQNFRGSKFLMGEAEGVKIKPDLSWLLDSREPRVQRVLQKIHYTFDDRDSFAESGVNAQKIETQIVQTNIKNSSDDATGIDGADSAQIRNLKLWLLSTIGCAAYRSWFEKVKFQICNQRFLIFSSSNFARDEIETRYSSLLQKHLAHLTHPLTLRILTNEV